jgi:LysM repeat protein
MNMFSESWAESRKMGGNFINVALSLVGIILGGLALYLFSIQGRHSNVSERLNTIETRINKNEEQLEALSFAQNEQLSKALTQLQKVQSTVTSMKHQLRGSSVTTLNKAAPTYHTGEPKTVNDTENGAIQSYTVRSGDTLSKIAVEQGVSVKRIMEMNPNVVPARLQVGQVIQIPASNIHE